MSEFTFEHDFGKCNENCNLKKWFNFINPVHHNIEWFLNKFYVPFECSVNGIIEKNSISIINILFIGEAGGEQEALYKRPFYPKAPSGKILREVIKDLLLKNYAIANIVGCRPVSIQKNKFVNRTPFESECEYCITYLKSFISLLNKNVKIILLGKTAAFSVLKNIKDYIKDAKTISNLVKLDPYIYKNRLFAANYHPRYIASSGGIKGKRYKKYLSRMEDILND